MTLVMKCSPVCISCYCKVNAFQTKVARGDKYLLFISILRSPSTPEEISQAFKTANMRALSRANNSHSSNCACSRDQTDATTFIGPEASVINDSTMLAGSADLFYSVQQPNPAHISATKHINKLIGE